MRVVKMVSNIGKGTYSEKLAKLNLTTLEERRWRGHDTNLENNARKRQSEGYHLL